MADRQTTGGYPKIATVITADLPLAGQLAPGDWIEFIPVTRAAALDALRQRIAGLVEPSSMTAFEQELADVLGPARVAAEVSLASFTTLRIGGPADWLVTVRSAEEILEVIAVARRHEVPVTVIGGGSNLLVADGGVRGLVVRVHGGDVTVLDAALIRADAGITINGLVRWTINRGVSGLEAWAGTPGTVGGAIHGNAHFQGRLIGELVERATLISREGAVAEVPAGAMEFAYDYSRLHRTGEIVVSVDFRVGSGDPQALRTVRASIACLSQADPAAGGCQCRMHVPEPRSGD